MLVVVFHASWTHDLDPTTPARHITSPASARECRHRIGFGITQAAWGYVRGLGSLFSIGAGRRDLSPALALDCAASHFLA